MGQGLGKVGKVVIMLLNKSKPKGKKTEQKKKGLKNKKIS